MTSRVKPSGTCGFFEQKPPLGGLGVDQRTHATLADHRAGMSAGRGIGE